MLKVAGDGGSGDDGVGDALGDSVENIEDEQRQ